MCIRDRVPVLLLDLAAAAAVAVAVVQAVALVQVSEADLAVEDNNRVPAGHNWVVEEDNNRVQAANNQAELVAAVDKGVLAVVLEAVAAVHNRVVLVAAATVHNRVVLVPAVVVQDNNRVPAVSYTHLSF